MAIFHILTKLNYLSTLCVGTSVPEWAGWATATYGRVGKLKTRVGKRKIFSALRAEFHQTIVCPPWPETVPAPLPRSRCLGSLQRSKGAGRDENGKGGTGKERVGRGEGREGKRNGKGGGIDLTHFAFRSLAVIYSI